MREVVTGLMYILSTVCQWRAIPRDLPPKSSVYDYFDLWTYDGTLERIHHALYEQCREQAQPVASPTAFCAIIDSCQSVKSAEERGGPGIDPHGYDAGKKIKGKKRHILVDTLGPSAPRRRPSGRHSEIAMAAFSSCRPCSGCSPFEDALRRRRISGDRNLRKRWQKLLPHLDVEIVKPFRSGQRICGLAHDAGSSSAPSLGSIAAEGSPELGEPQPKGARVLARPPQSASCSENSAIRPEVSGQTLTLQLSFCFEVRALSDRLVSSTPE